MRVRRAWDRVPPERLELVPRATAEAAPRAAAGTGSRHHAEGRRSRRLPAAASMAQPWAGRPASDGLPRRAIAPDGPQADQVRHLGEQVRDVLGIDRNLRIHSGYWFLPGRLVRRDHGGGGAVFLDASVGQDRAKTRFIAAQN